MKTKNTMRLSALFLAVIMILTMIPATVFTAFAADATEQYDILYVAGTKVTPENKGDILGDGKVSYDPTTKTLTLNNATLAANQNTQMYPAPIETDVQQSGASWDLTIYLKGTNTLDTFDYYNYILHRAGNLVITGDEDAVLTNTNDAPNNNGINAFNGKLTVQKVKIDLTYGASAYGDLLYGRAGISIEDGADLTLVGGTGSAVWGGEGDVAISGSTVKASSAGSQAMGCAGNIAVTDNAVVEAATTHSTNAVWACAGDPYDSSKGHISVSNKAKLTVSNISDYYPAMYADGTVTVDDAELIASSTESGALGAGGTLCIQNNAFVNAESGTSTASVIWSNTAIKINGAELAAENTAGSSVISSWGTITASNGAVVTAANTAGEESAIIAQNNLSILDSTVNVTAKGAGHGISTNANMFIEQKTGTTTVTASSKTSVAVYASGDINISGTASVTASGAWALWSKANNIKVSGGKVEAFGSSYAIVSKPDLSGYTRPVVLAGSSADSAEPVTDLTGTNYHNTSNYVLIQPGSLITFQTDYGTAPASMTVAKDTVITLPKMEDDGDHVFVGWWGIAAASDVLLYSAGEEYKVTKDVTFIAEWDEIVTLTVPFTTTVELGDKGVPGETVFTLEVVSVNVPEEFEDIYKDVTFSTSVTTNGKGNYDGTMTFTGLSRQLRDMLTMGVFVQQVDDGKENWTYDDAVWYLILASDPEVAMLASTNEVLPEDPAPEYKVLIFQAICEETEDGPVYYLDWENMDWDAPEAKMLFTNTYTAHDYTLEHNETEHWDKCGCGDVQNKEAHRYGEWTVTKEATETENGEKKHTCTVCGYTETVEIEKLPHTDSQSPQTGDNSNVALWIALLFISGGAVITLTVVDRKRRTVNR